MRKRLGRFTIEWPKSNVMSLSRSGKWLYKSLDITYWGSLSFKKIIRFQLVYWCKKNSNYQDYLTIMDKYHPTSRPAAFPKKVLDLGFLKLSVTFLEKKQ